MRRPEQSKRVLTDSDSIYVHNAGVVRPILERMTARAGQLILCAKKCPESLGPFVA
jgi:hypothetical protein